MATNYSIEEAHNIAEAYVFQDEDIEAVFYRSRVVRSLLESYSAARVGALPHPQRQIFCLRLKALTPKTEKPFPVVQLWAICLIIVFLILILYMQIYGK